MIIDLALGKPLPELNSCWESFGEQLAYHEFWQGLFPILSDFIMAVNYLMTAFSLYQIFYDKTIKIVYSLMYLVFLALDVWWLVGFVILIKNKGCISDVT